MFEKYFVINESNIICGQTSSGTWYCKELPCKTEEEAEIRMLKMNKILNKINSGKDKSNENLLEFKKKKE